MNATFTAASRTKARRRRFLSATALLLVLAACAPTAGPAATLSPLERAEPRIAFGERVFAAQCHQCHPNAHEGLAPSIVGTPIPAWLIRVQVRRGLGQMPAFSDDELADDALDAIIAYLSALRDAATEGDVAQRTAP